MTHPTAALPSGIPRGTVPAPDPIVATCPVCGLRIRESRWGQYPYVGRSGAQREIETRRCAPPCAGRLVVAYVDGRPHPITGQSAEEASCR